MESEIYINKSSYRIYQGKQYCPSVYYVLLAQGVTNERSWWI